MDGPGDADIVAESRIPALKHQARNQPRVLGPCIAKACRRVAAVERHPKNVRMLRVRAKKAQNPSRLLRLGHQAGFFDAKGIITASDTKRE